MRTPDMSKPKLHITANIINNVNLSKNDTISVNVRQTHDIDSDRSAVSTKGSKSVTIVFSCTFYYVFIYFFI